MNYVIALLADRIQAESAYSALEQEGLPMEQISLLGKGYKSADEFGFIDPQNQARKRAKLMSFWLVPFGFVGGVAFNLSTQYQLVPAAGVLGNQIIGGILGAIGGAMGSLFVGGGFGFGGGNNNEMAYHDHLKQGKYVLVVQGTPNITNKASRVLKGCNPENLQSYVDPTNI